MERNTLTTLSELREGDRFHYPKRVDVWEVVAKTRTHVAINLPVLNGEYAHKYPELKRGNTQVVFMRHTQPLPGERCLFQDLKPGDVFHLPSDIIKEYLVDSFKVSTGGTTLSCEAIREIRGTDLVIFVRSQN